MFIGFWKIWQLSIENLGLKLIFHQISFKTTVILLEFLRKIDEDVDGFYIKIQGSQASVWRELRSTIGCCIVDSRMKVVFISSLYGNLL